MEPRILKTEDKKEHFIMKRAVYQEMVDYCQAAIPIEACGLLSGRQGMGSRLWKIKNQLQSPNRFYMSKESIKQAVCEMERGKEELIGIFHSHPSAPAFPSSSDIRNNPYNQLAYLIVSFNRGRLEVGCFKTDGQKAKRLELIVID
ncbi:M67 family metallopeptidase [Bacillus rubiinfantis]|uniref:M67 family metallopeptidase n=1 Tax=Bacillus rubiinfantis TaxID=1499680 RepID=UPI000694A666|nr:M67 family metallopeptidase [Bacillus rubiinfantis]